MSMQLEVSESIYDLIMPYDVWPNGVCHRQFIYWPYYVIENSWATFLLPRNVAPNGLNTGQPRGKRLVKRFR